MADFGVSTGKCFFSIRPLDDRRALEGEASLDDVVASVDEVVLFVSSESGCTSDLL